jgi:hypothetical protein
MATHIHRRDTMSVATTSMFLFIGLDDARRDAPGESWPNSGHGGLTELLDWVELQAVHLERTYDKEFADLDYPGMFDYEVTVQVGGWLYANPEADVSDMADEARRLVHKGIGEIA